MAKAKKQTEPESRTFDEFVKRKPELTVLTDHPLTVEQIEETFTDDPFNLRYKLGPVYDIIRCPDTKTPTSLLITGDWGTGKTSAMKWLECLLEKWNETGPVGRTKVRPVWFYPWKYHTREDVWRGLVAEVIANSIDVENMTLRRLQYASVCFVKLLLKIPALFLDSAKIKLQSPDGLLAVEMGPGTLKKILTEYHKTAHPDKAYRNKFEKALNFWVKCTLGNKERMIVFVDDLDRCMPEIGLQVLEALKLYLNIPNLIFVLGVDKEVMQKLVFEHYRELGLVKDKDMNREEKPEEEQARTRAERKARQYLSKMFQTEIELSPSQKQITDFFEKQLKNITLWNERLGNGTDSAEGYKSLFERLVLKFARRNPRELKRQLNNAMMAGVGTEMIDVKKDDDKPTFVQGLQLYFICEILKGYTLISDMIDTDSGRRFFKDWSDLAIAWKDVPEKDRYPESSGEPEAGVEVDPSGQKSSLSEKLAEKDTVYESKQYLQLLNNLDLRALVEIPFSTKLAEFTVQISTTGATKPSKATFTPEEALEMKERMESRAYIIVRDAVARQLNKNPDEVEPDDYRNITKLDLSKSGISDLTPLKDFKNLKSLNLRETQVSDISVLSSLSMLQDLNLFNTKVGNIRALSGLTNLQELSIARTQVSDIDVLESLKELRELHLGGIQISDIGVLRTLTNLERLGLEDTQVSDMDPLGSLTNLQMLWLSGTVVNDLSPLVSLTNLQILVLHETKVTEVEPLGSLKALKMLWLSGTQVRDVSPLGSLTNLRKLDLDGTHVNDVSSLVSLVNLRELNLSNIPLRDVVPLDSLVNLQRLWLRGTKVTDIRPLSSLTNLERLWLSNMFIDNIEPLARLVNLQRLDLRRSKIVNVGPLASLENLQTLNLSDTQVCDISPLSSLLNLQGLSLNDTQVNDIGPLRSLESLQRLYLSRTQVIDLSPLYSLTNLQELSLDSTSVGDEQLVKLRKVLPKLRIVKKGEESIDEAS